MVSQSDLHARPRIFMMVGQSASIILYVSNDPPVVLQY